MEHPIFCGYNLFKTKIHRRSIKGKRKKKIWVNWEKFVILPRNKNT